jgi:hypothetical protein
MSHPSQPMHRSLRFENLESKEVLSGNVLVSLSGSSVFIEGDVDDNQIEISEVGTNMIQVAGLGTTTINGLTTPVVISPPVAGAIDHILAKMRDGDDLVRVVDLDLTYTPSGILEIYTETGNDRVALNSVKTSQSIKIDTGEHNDKVRSIHTKTKHHEVHTGNGHDSAASLNFVTSVMTSTSLEGDDRVYMRSGVVWNSLEAQTGPQNDKVVIRDVSVTGDSLIDTDTFDNANGIDYVRVSGFTSTGDLDIRSGLNDDSVRVVASQIGQHLIIDTSQSNNASGDDQVFIRQSTVGGYVSVQTGGGEDLLRIQGLFITLDLKAVTGAGDDTVGISNVVARNVGLITAEGKDKAKFYSVHTNIFLQVYMGADDDQFGILYSSSGVDPEFDGGSADDIFYLNTNYFPNPSDSYSVNFEAFL